MRELSSDNVVRTGDGSAFRNGRLFATDSLVQMTCIGYAAIGAVTAVEMALEDVDFRFSVRTRPLMGALSRTIFDRMNGRISSRDLRDRCCEEIG